MKKYIHQIILLSKRPILNGIDGKIKKRSATPLELFFDLIFVIALSTISYIISDFTISSLIFSILLYCTIYATWFYLTLYNVMFMKNEANYLLRLLVFIVMLPMVMLLSIKSLDSAKSIVELAVTLGITKLLLAYIFRDAVVNANVNNIVISKMHKMTSKYLFISGVLLVSVCFIPTIKYLVLILILVFFLENIYINYKHQKIEKKLPYDLLLDKELLSERHLLFLILVFGESVVKLVHSYSIDDGALSILNMILIFTITYLFYLRIYEETLHNKAFIDESNNSIVYLFSSLNVLILFLVLGEMKEYSLSFGYVPMFIKFILVVTLSYICSIHSYYNLRNLKFKKSKKGKLFNKIDLITLIPMEILAILIMTINNITIIYLIIAMFFFLHTLALPFREDLLEDGCELIK